MTFTPPSELNRKTSEIRDKYTKFLGRYSTSPGSKHANSLIALIAQVDAYVSQCGTERIGERDSLVKIRNEANTDIGSNPDEVKRATYFLLGALIHRYFRLKQSYSTWNVAPLSWLYTSKPEKSDLYLGIKSALNLENNPLDVVTIVHSLEIFRDNMLSSVELKGAPGVKSQKYKDYPHLKDDVNFEAHLNLMIREHYESDVAGLIKQFQMVTFLENFAAQIEADRVSLEQELGQWCKSGNKPCALTSKLLKENLEVYFSDRPEKEQNDKKGIKEELLKLVDTAYLADELQAAQLVAWCKLLKSAAPKQATEEFIVQHFTTHFASNPDKQDIYNLICAKLDRKATSFGGEAQKTLFDFFNNKPVFNSIASQKELDYSMLFEKLKISNAMMGNFKLCGLYLFLLDCGNLDDALKSYMKTALELSRKPSNSETLLYAEFLQNYIEKQPETKLYDEVFIRKDKAETQISQWVMSFKKEQEREEERGEEVVVLGM